jgi:diguanylate cyclase (GGDEF)-like protein/PAS domain S-box-containing protein
MVQRITESSTSLLYIFDLVEQKLVYANRELTTILGFTFADLQEMGLEMIALLTHPDDLQHVMSHHDRMLNAADDAHLDIEYRMRHKNGGWRWLSSRDVVFSRTPEGLPHQILGSAQDTTERKRIEEQIETQMLALNEYSLQLEMQQIQLEQVNAQLESLATTDGLTGLKNIRAFQERLGEEFARAKRFGEPFSVILLDVDHFKQYNDSFGHPAGDEVLKSVAQILMTSARDTDYVARYGGEEFIMYLPYTGAEGAMRAAEVLRLKIQAAEWKHRPITVSLGISVLSPSVTSPAMLIEDADKALYLSKSGGRNLSTLHEDEYCWTAPLGIAC